MSNNNSDQVYIDFLKELSKKEPEDIVSKETNVEIERLFPNKKSYVTKKKATNYLLYLVPYMMTIINTNSFDEVLSLLTTIFYKMYAKSSTLDVAFTKYIRKPTFKKYGKKSVEHMKTLKLAKLTGEDKGELIATQKTNLVNAQKEIFRYNSEEVFKLIKNGINSEDVYEKAVALALACGSRPVELFDPKITFEKVNSVYITQSKVAKKRDAIVPVDKPIIGMNTDRFIKEIDDMRGYIKLDFRVIVNSNGELNGAITKSANLATKKLFNNSAGITFYSCRKIYVDLSYELYAKDGRFGVDPTKAYWILNVLKHKDEDINTQHHYSYFKEIEKDVNVAEFNKLKVELEELKRIVSGKETIEVKKNVKISSAAERVKKERFETIKKVFDEQADKPTQTEMEKLMAGKVPRSVVREWYKTGS